MHKSIYNQNIVYLFTNYKGQKYIGSKTNCIVENNKILQKGNKPYFTSSTNKEFKQSLETHEYKLEILFTTLDKTINIVEKERYYQLKYDVLNNNEFVNKTITHPKFNNIGRITLIHKVTKNKINIHINDFELYKNNYDSLSKGKITVYDVEAQQFKSITIEKYNNNKERYKINSNWKNTVLCRNTISNEICRVSKDEYYNNPIYESLTKDKIVVYDNELNKNTLIDKKDKNNPRYTKLSNKIPVYDNILKKRCCISSETFKQNKTRYTTLSSINNGMKNKINVWDKNNACIKTILKEDYNEIDFEKIVSVYDKLEDIKKCIPKSEYIKFKSIRYLTTTSKEYKNFFLNVKVKGQETIESIGE